MTPRRLRAVPDAGGIRAVLYVRVSAVMGRDDDGTFHSPELQTKAMRDLLARRGLQEVDVVEDIDVSGRTFERAGIQKVLELARARRVDVVALYDLSRLGRNTAESLRTIAELRELGVTVVSTTEQIDDTPEGQFQLGVFLGMAQLYSDQIARKWRQVHDHRVEQGLHHGGPAPVGYRRGEAGVFEPDPVWAPRILELFEAYAAGASLHGLYRDFHRRYGLFAGKSSVQFALRNPAYVGMIRRHGRLHQGQHGPIVPKALWERVQRRIGVDAKIPPRALAYSFSLATSVWCDHCNGRLHKIRQHDRPGREPIDRLVCGNARLPVPTCAGIGSARLESVEAEVLRQLTEKIASWELDGADRAGIRLRQLTAKADVTRLKREITAAETALGRLTADRARRSISETAYAAAARELEGGINDLRDALAAAETALGAPTPEAAVNAASEVLSLWPDATGEERRRLLQPLVRSVRIRRPASYREPFEGRVDVDFTF